MDKEIHEISNNMVKISNTIKVNIGHWIIYTRDYSYTSCSSMAFKDLKIGFQSLKIIPFDNCSHL